MAKLRFPISLLVAEADHITDAFTANSVPMAIRLADPYNADTIALTLLVISQGAKQASDTADIGDLTLAQAAALAVLSGKIKNARNTAKRAFRGQTVKLHEEFQVGETADDLDSVLERAAIISASLKRAENLAALTGKGWIAADTVEFDAALAALDLNEDTQEEAKTVKLGTTATRDENASELYERLLTIQNAARIQFPESVANTAVRAAFRLGLFPSKGEEEELVLPGPAQITLSGTDPGTYLLSLSAENDDPSVTGYDVFERFEGGVWVKVGDNVPGGDFPRLGLAAGNYEVKAQARNASGVGPESDVIALVVPA